MVGFLRPTPPPAGRAVIGNQAEIGPDDRAVAVQADSVSKRYRIYHNKSRTLKEAIFRGRGQYEDFDALSDVSVTVHQGESVGILGANGSGKSTLLKLIARIIRPDRGRVTVNGTVSALLEVGAGFHPEYTGRENIYLYAALLGLNRAEINARFGQIVEFSGLERFIDNPVKNYSSGMYMRLGFAVAIHVDPDVILIDEVLAVGDAAFQRKCLERIADLRGAGRTIVFVSHDLRTMRELCQRALWIDQGRVMVDGPADRSIALYGQSQQEPAQVSTLDADRLRRWGSREAQIDGMRLLDQDARPVDALEHGQPGAIEVVLSCQQYISGLSLGVAVFKRDGTYCMGLSTGYEGLTADLRPGSHAFRLEFASQALAPGSYLVDLGAFEHQTGHVYDFHSRGHVLEIRGDGHGEGIFIAPHRWYLDNHQLEDA
jgi:ABC-type polysaccharide/polyol phosphate transport system ATPase subunit